MSEHTPGPWAVAYDDKHGQAVVSGPHTEIATCWHHSVGSIEKQMRANARLIAAAPCLLEALESAPIIGGTEPSWIFRQRQNKWLSEVYNPAIARAKGEA